VKQAEPVKKEKRILWIFRTNIRALEYYHKYREINEFKNNCHDFYLLMGLWYVENDVFDEVIVWRLNPEVKYQVYKEINDIVFIVHDRVFVQKFVNSLYNIVEVLKLPKPTMSFFRGGFQEYCMITKRQPGHFGTSLYLGAGRRVFPQYGGSYKKVLVESDEDLKHSLTGPFFKTANNRIFYPIKINELKYDLCWICNFTQVNYKGQEYFIEQVSKSKFLKRLKIVHVGNEPEKGVAFCKRFGVSNITFVGYHTRPEINMFLNQSKLAIVTSDENDGSPRVITEILMSCTPLLIREKTRALSFYKEKGVIEFADNNLEDKAKHAFNNISFLRQQLVENLNNISLAQICNLNYKVWTS
jgi:hypothetical protein